MVHFYGIPNSLPYNLVPLQNPAHYMLLFIFWFNDSLLQPFFILTLSRLKGLRIHFQQYFCLALNARPFHSKKLVQKTTFLKIHSISLNVCHIIDFHKQNKIWGVKILSCVMCIDLFVCLQFILLPRILFTDLNTTNSVHLFGQWDEGWGK